MNNRGLMVSMLICSLFAACASTNKKGKKQNKKNKTTIAKEDRLVVLKSDDAKKRLLTEKIKEKKIALFKEKVDTKKKRGTIRDYIVCRVNGANILYSDLQGPRIDKNGQKYSMDELIAEELLWQKALELKVVPAAQEIEHRITSIKQAHDLLDASDEEFEQWLRFEAGMTLAELKRQLLRIGAATQVKMWNAQESSVVSEKEKEEYFGKREFKEDASYLLKVILKGEDEADGIESIALDSDEWVTIGWVKDSEIAPAMESIKELTVNAISKPFKTEHGYQIVAVVDKKPARIKSYDECALDIEKRLIYKKQKKADKKLIKRLKERASILMLEK